MSNTSSELRKRVLSGMRPTGKLHLGNYMGALYNWVRLQHEYECYFFVADWHALTTDYADPSQVKKNTLDVALDFLAAGLDPEKCTIFVQSHVPQHAELHLAFSMMTPLGWLERVPTYKDQIENLKHKDLTTYGFLGYPLLQSADILVYQADYVPVGADQVAHVELTREVARRFNSLYRANVFPEPDALLTPTPKLPGTDGRKMSKSYGNTIGLTEDPASAKAKVQTMSTNGQRVRQTDPGDPDLCPVGDLHKIFSSQDVIEATQAGCRTASIRCEFCKAEAAQSVIAVTGPIHARRLEYESKIGDTWDMLVAQGERAAKRANQTMEQVRELLSIGRKAPTVMREIGLSVEERKQQRDLTSYREWLELPYPERTKQVRAYWSKYVLPIDVNLSDPAARQTFASIERELEEPLLTKNNKRVLVSLSEADGEAFLFQLPVKSYEVWALLCWNEKTGWLSDLVLPQKVYSMLFAQAKKTAKKAGSIRLRVERHEEAWTLAFPDLADAGAIDVTEFSGNYQPLG